MCRRHCTCRKKLKIDLINSAPSLVYLSQHLTRSVIAKRRTAKKRLVALGLELQHHISPIPIRIAKSSSGGSHVATSNMLPTPSTSHVSFDNIYEPAEDSYLLLDTLSASSETEFLSTRFPPSTPSPLVLEVGVGSGVVLAFVAANAQTIFNRSDVAFLGSDVNTLAAKAATQTVDLAIAEIAPQIRPAPVSFGVAVADLASAVREKDVDVLIFNPPYVPTEDLPAPLDDTAMSSGAVFERDSKLLELSYAGGVDGMETTDRLLDQLPTILSERGVAYVLLCAQNKPEAVKASIRARPGGWNAETVGFSGKKAGWEKLVIVRIWRG